MSLAKANKEAKFDKRLTEQKLAKGELTKEELKQHLDALPDLKDKVELVNLDGERSRMEHH